MNMNNNTMNMNEEESRNYGHPDDHDIIASSRRETVPSTPESGSLFGGSPDALYFKILCPLSITGLIIGRGGSIINQLNNTCGARIRLSQNHEYFPGTQDRVLLLKGDRDGISNALRELVSRIAEAPEKKTAGSPTGEGPSNPASQPNRGPQGTYQIKVLIPKVASAAIIGKGGSVIKRMSEVSGARYQLGDEMDPYNTKERIVTITSLTVHNLVMGAQTLMNQLFDENRVRTYANLTTNYVSGANSPVPFNGKSGQHIPPPPHHQQSSQQAGVPMAMAPSQGTPQMMPPGMMHHPQMVAIQGAPPSGYPMPPPHMHPGGFVTAPYPQLQIPMIAPQHMQHAPPGQGHPGQYQMMSPQQYPIPGGPPGHMYGYGPAVGVPMHEPYQNVMSQHIPPAPNAGAAQPPSPHQHMAQHGQPSPHPHSHSPHHPHPTHQPMQHQQHPPQGHIQQAGMYPPMAMNK